MSDIESSSLVPISIEDEMKSSFLEYSMSVIVARALPDVRDGLKPVHRRILFAMNDKGNVHNKAYRKSANTVGEVLGSYHPHGDSAIYDAMVRMAQPFSLRYPLVDGQGNFGSVDGDSAAAMRYTEARLSRLAGELLEDLDRETVDFVPNYDESKREPSVLPSKLPNLLINGSGGIAVGMATNIPPHNLGEVVDGLVHLIDHPDCGVEDLIALVPGPDFPTAGEIHGTAGIRAAYYTGRGHVIMRAKAHIEPMEKGDRERIVLTEIPYQVNKARLIEKIAELVRDKKIAGISDLRDESDRRGMRVVIELKRDAVAKVVLNQLYKQTQMQDTFGVILIALVDGQPRQLTLKEMLYHFVEHRREIVTRRTLFDLRKAREREHILQGYVKALDHLDQVIELIRHADSPDSAKSGLMERFGFTDIQAKAILELRLQRLTGMERKKITDELEALLADIGRLEYIRDHEDEKYRIIKEELLSLKETYGDPRRTAIVPNESEVMMEDLIPKEDVVVTITTSGYIKRSPLSEFRAQRRGGKGVRGLAMKEEDAPRNLFVANSHDHLLFFTDTGRVFSARVFEAPEGSRTSKGKSVNNLLQLRPDEKVATVFPIEAFHDDHYLVMATASGLVKKTPLSAYGKIHAGGIIGIDLAEGDQVISAKVTDGKSKILLSVASGMTILFPESDIRSMGRVARGVKGINLAEGDRVVGMAACAEAEMTEQALFTLKANGYGKRTPLARYRQQRRGGKGLIDIKTDDAPVVGVKKVSGANELMMMTDDGAVIRIKASDVSLIGRNTKGVRVVNVGDGAVVSLGRLEIDTGETVDVAEKLTPEEAAGLDIPEPDDETLDETVDEEPHADEPDA
ncbi:MAG: DNA gyrase subunit A [Nitrospinae bacterium]|nr:DNA gyrase subunit A [Nitrospinota bacterium]